MKRVIIISAILAVVSSPSSAKPKTRTFQQPCGVVFPIAEKMSSEKPYHLLLDGKKDMILRVQTGSFWKAGARDIDVQFSDDTNGSCTVTDNTPYAGVMRHGTVYLDRLEKLIKDVAAEKQTPPAQAAPPAAEKPPAH